jgi:hypothetical protein
MMNNYILSRIKVVMDPTLIQQSILHAVLLLGGISSDFETIIIAAEIISGKPKQEVYYHR